MWMQVYRAVIAVNSTERRAVTTHMNVWNVVASLVTGVIFAPIRLTGALICSGIFPSTFDNIVIGKLKSIFLILYCKYLLLNGPLA